MLMQGMHTKLRRVPNVVVAHQKEGIEALHLPTGQTLCKLHLLEGGLHADVNGDGVLDHVQAVGGNVGERTVVSGSMEVLKPCRAVATSGDLPSVLQFLAEEFSPHLAQTRDTSTLEIATPILIHRDDRHRHCRGSQRDVIFLTNHGEVTSYTPDVLGNNAIWQWQLQTEATWSNLPSPSGLTVVPTMKTFSVHIHDSQPMILAAGDQAAVIISPGGSVLASIQLLSQPTHELVTDDFSNDSLTDLIVLTSNGTYGFVQTRQTGALFLRSFVGCLLVLMGLFVITRALTLRNQQPFSSFV